MASNRMSSLIQHVRNTVLGRDGAGLTDGKLLECFITQRDEAAFAALVRRHGPLVWGVCERVLRSHHDAEDAFQATFLVLARKAANVTSGRPLANWLHGVAYRTALQARSANARRQVRERQLPEMPEPKTMERELWEGARPILDEELSQLPDKYRAVILLCDLEGKTRKQAARELGIPEGTVASRLATAREKMVQRLTRRGVGVSGAALAATLTAKAAAAVPPAVVSATIKAATLVAVGQAAGVVSTKVAALMHGVVQAMFIKKLMRITLVLVVLGTAGLGAGLLQHQMAAGEQNAQTPGAGTQEKPKALAPLAQNPKVQKPGTQDDTKAKIDLLIVEIAKLRQELGSALKEMRSWKDGQGQNAVPKGQGPLYQGKSLGFWLEQFKDADESFRSGAVDALGVLSKKNKELIPVLVDALQDSDSVGGKASSYLGLLGPEVLPALLKVLRDKKSAIAVAHAASAVSIMGPKAKAAVPLLSQSLKMDDWNVRYYAITALGEIGPESKPAIPAMIDVLGELLKALELDIKQGNQKHWDAGVLGQSLRKIEPGIQDIVPRGGIFGFERDGSLEHRLTLWVQAYEALKKKYQMQK
jgi:RNA polymerase sigma factor (sigma-70 family)